MTIKKNAVRAMELPTCPFCNGAVYYKNWVTHRIFQMECEACKSHWRTGINQNPERDMYVELIDSKNTEELHKYLNKKHPIIFWQNLKEQLA